MSKTKTTTPKKKTSENIQEKIKLYETKIAQIDDVILAEANEDVATFTIDKWQVALVAVIITVILLVVIL